MKTYRCLLFDLFSTVALWDATRMPRLVLNGVEQPSTLGVLAETLNARHPSVAFDEFVAAVTATNAELSAKRAQDGREITSAERFRQTLARMDLGHHEDTDDLAASLSARHMSMLREASAVPSSHGRALKSLAARYPLALVSNFDHAPTARAILERDGVHDHFEHVLISDDHGWRKPHRKIFDDALALLGCAAHEALFIGDSPEDDVAGASAAGLDCVWVNARGVELPAGTPRPTAEVSNITELEALL